MYVPEHFALSGEQISHILKEPVAGDLITLSEDGLQATYIPMLFEPIGEHGVLTGHLSSINTQWRDQGEALFIVHGPGDYIESQWLSRPEARSVPTWNYVSVHAHGELITHRDREWCLESVRKLSAARGDTAIEELSDDAIDRLLRAVVGVELQITKLVGKAKMSQNKPPEVIEQVIAGLQGRGNSDAAGWMQANSLPRAQAKAALVEGIRQRGRQQSR